MEAPKQCVVEAGRNELMALLLVSGAALWSTCRVEDVDNPGQHVPYVHSLTITENGWNRTASNLRVQNDYRSISGKDEVNLSTNLK